jgi:quinol-cytochrome oxidoreductase complex cytochrome b subunit
LSDQVAYDIGVFPALGCRAVLHVFCYVVAPLVPTNAHFLALIETTAENPSRQKTDTDVRRGWQWSAGVIAVMVLDKVLLTIKNAATPVHDTAPVFTSLVHSCFMLLPV